MELKDLLRDTTSTLSSLHHMMHFSFFKFFYFYVDSPRRRFVYFRYRVPVSFVYRESHRLWPPCTYGIIYVCTHRNNRVQDKSLGIRNRLRLAGLSHTRGTRTRVFFQSEECKYAARSTNIRRAVFGGRAKAHVGGGRWLNTELRRARGQTKFKE